MNNDGEFRMNRDLTQWQIARALVLVQRKEP
jgi:hypothetical protein